jgi:hypothetical protein
MNVLALEPDALQAATIRKVVCGAVCARLTLVQFMDAALRVLREQTPDIVLLPALVSPAEEKQLLDSLRSLPRGAHVEVLITPSLSVSVDDSSPVSRLRPWKGSRRRARPPSVEELRDFQERLRWSFARARERQQLDAVSEPPEQTAVEAPDVQPPSLPGLEPAAPVPQAPAERRLDRRFTAGELRGLHAVRIPLGPAVSLVDVSAGGALVESDQPLRRDAEARLELTGEGGVTTVPFRVVRSWVSGLDGTRRFRGAFRFSEPLDLTSLMLPDAPPAPGAGPRTQVDRLDVAFETILAQWVSDSHDALPAASRADTIEQLRALRASGQSATGNPAGKAAGALLDQAIAAAEGGELRKVTLGQVERLVGQAMPALTVRFAGSPGPSPAGGELLYFRVPARSGCAPRVLNIEVPHGATLEAWQFRLLKASTWVAAVVAGESVRRPPDRRTGTDRRRHVRVAGPLEGRRLGAIDTPVLIQNISEGGCFVSSLVDVEGERELTLGIAVPDGEWITARGEVVHGQPGFGFAIRFVEISEGTRASLARLVAARLAAAAPVTMGAMVTESRW